jgi:hypothetical protein
MGAANALAAYRLYAGKIPPLSMNALAYMSLVALDKDGEPSWWEGHEMLAVRCLGRPEPVTKSDLRAVERAITPLFGAGAITTVRHASGHHGRLVTVRYRLWLQHPAPDEKRRKPGVSTRRNVTQLPTFSDAAPDEKRRTKEKEEEEERDIGVAVIPPTVEGAESERARQLAALEQLMAQTGDIHVNGQAPRQCAADGCSQPVEGKQPARYCSRACKNRETKRRTRAAVRATS